MHRNERFNIMQAPYINSRQWVVIDGQRTASGHAASGAKIVSEPMLRDEAIALADRMQTSHDLTERRNDDF